VRACVVRARACVCVRARLRSHARACVYAYARTRAPSALAGVWFGSLRETLSHSPPAARYLRTAPNSSAAALVDNSFDRARCTSSVVHPNWLPTLARNDLALCFFEGASRFKPVELAKGEGPCLGRGRSGWRVGVAPRHAHG
jgi:hypothetical protein